jgi:hypothetical protein
MVLGPGLLKARTEAMQLADINQPAAHRLVDVVEVARTSSR